MQYGKLISTGYILAVGIGIGGAEISETEYNEILSVIQNKPAATETTDYLLREDLTWEEYHHAPIDPPIDETDKAQALTRFINEHTDENDPDLVSATETLIKNTITEA